MLIKMPVSAKSSHTLHLFQGWVFGAGQRRSNDSQRSVQGLKYHPSNSKATSKCYPKLVTTFLKKNILQVKVYKVAKNKHNPKQRKSKTICRRKTEQNWEIQKPTLFHSS